MKLHKYKKGYDFLLGRMYFTGNGYQNFLVFAPTLSSLILDSNKKVTNWISTGITSEKIKPNCLFGTAKLTRNADKTKLTYNGRGIVAFDGKAYWSLIITLLEML